MERFCKSAYNFIISVALQIKQRFNDFKHPTYDATQCLRPKNAFSIEFKNKNPNAFLTLLATFPKLSGDEGHKLRLTSEWDLLTSVTDIPDVLKAYNDKIEDICGFFNQNKKSGICVQICPFCTLHSARKC